MAVRAVKSGARRVLMPRGAILPPQHGARDRRPAGNRTDRTAFDAAGRADRAAWTRWARRPGRAGALAAELLRRHGGPGRPDRLGAFQRRTGGRGSQSDRPGAARTAGTLGRRGADICCGKAQPLLSAGGRRPLPGLSHLQVRAGPPASRPADRPHARPGRQTRIHADAAGARAAHPALQGQPPHRAAAVPSV